DRFGLTVEVRAARDVETRVEVVRRRLAFEADPVAFGAAWQEQERATARRIAEARERVGTVVLPDAELRRIAAVCAAFDVDGMRADRVIARAAAAHAAWRGADAGEEEDVRVAARLALPHRRRRDPFHEPGMDDQALVDALREAAEQEPPDGPDDRGPDDGGPGGGGVPENGDAPEVTGSRSDAADGTARPAGDGRPQAAPPASAPFRARLLQVPGIGDGAPGRRSRARTDTGRVVRASGAAPSRSEAAAGPARPAGDAAPRAEPPASPPYGARLLRVPGIGDGAPGRRSRARTDAGRVVRAAGAAPRRAADLHLPATIAA